MQHVCFYTSMHANNYTYIYIYTYICAIFTHLHIDIHIYTYIYGHPPQDPRTFVSTVNLKYFHLFCDNQIPVMASRFCMSGKKQKTLNRL